MKRNGHVRMSLVYALLVFVICGCATSDVPNLEDNSVFKKDPIVFDASITDVKKAVLEAATALNCRNLAETDAYYKGQLPFGEVVEIFLKPNGSGKTSAWVKSRKTYVGGAWQRDRETEVVQELKRAVTLITRKAL